MKFCKVCTRLWKFSETFGQFMKLERNLWPLQVVKLYETFKRIVMIFKMIEMCLKFFEPFERRIVSKACKKKLYETFKKCMKFLKLVNCFFFSENREIILVINWFSSFVKPIKNSRNLKKDFVVFQDFFKAL